VADQPYTLALAWHPHASRLAAQPGWRRTGDDDPQLDGTVSGMAAPRVMAWSSLENDGFAGRWVSRATSRSRTRDDRIVSAGVAVDPIVRTGSAHVGTASVHVGMSPVSSGAGIFSVDLLQPIRRKRSCRR
jgi:hypothetical protein